jgi:hypothetical protein
MFIVNPDSGGKTARCSRSLTLLPILALMVFAFSSPVQAQFHGVAMAKQCGTSRVCDTDIDCSDGNMCTPDVCDDTFPEITTCFIRITNDDDFDDTLQINSAYDIIHAAGGDVRVPVSPGDLPISSVSGNTTCVVGPFVPCDIGPDAGGGPGQVVFQSTGYNPTPADFALPDNKLLDDGTVVVADKCDAPGTSGCSTTPQPQNFGAATLLVDACSSGPPTDCDDGDACTDDSCDPATGLCVNTPNIDCDDGDACTDDSCDPATGLCVNTPNIDCDDGDACTDDSCDPATGLCVNTPNIDCDDGDACTDDSCDPATGLCVNTPNIDCDDGDACTDDSCDPATGLCVNAPNIDCDDGDACTDDSCDPATGLCVNTPNIDCDDGDACTDDSCDPATGLCVNTPNIDCDDGDACTDDSCDPATGLCVNAPNIDCDDGDACTDDSCDPATGDCVNAPNFDCDDGDVCTDDSCDPATGECVHVDNGECNVDICRTPGFWATHGGDSKNRSTDITQAVIDYAGGLSVCGQTIATTDPATMWSSSNAMCTAVKGIGERQLVRQLTAHALNCVMSGGGGDCVGTGEEYLHTQCNLTCQGLPSDLSINECVSAIDCFNNGGKYEDGVCKSDGGICEGPEGYGDLCNSEDVCLGDGEVCVPENCHTRDLCLEGTDLCFQPPGPAGGVDNCKVAKKNGTYLPY